MATRSLLVNDNCSGSLGCDRCLSSLFSPMSEDTTECFLQIPRDARRCALKNSAFSCRTWVQLFYDLLQKFLCTKLHYCCGAQRHFRAWTLRAWSALLACSTVTLFSGAGFWSQCAFFSRIARIWNVSWDVLAAFNIRNVVYFKLCTARPNHLNPWNIRQVFFFMLLKFCRST